MGKCFLFLWMYAMWKWLSLHAKINEKQVIYVESRQSNYFPQMPTIRRPSHFVSFHSIPYFTTCCSAILFFIYRLVGLLTDDWRMECTKHKHVVHFRVGARLIASYRGCLSVFSLRYTLHNEAHIFLFAFTHTLTMSMNIKYYCFALVLYRSFWFDTTLISL